MLYSSKNSRLNWHSFLEWAEGSHHVAVVALARESG